MPLSRRALFAAATGGFAARAFGQASDVPPMASVRGFAGDRLERNMSQWLKTFNIHRQVDLIEIGQGAGAGLLAGHWLEASFLATEWSGDGFLRQRSSGMLDRILGAQRPGEGPPFPEMDKVDVQAIAGAMNTAAALWGNGPAAALAARLGSIEPGARPGLDPAALVRLAETEHISNILPDLSRILDRTGDGVWGDVIESLLWNQMFACQLREGDSFRARVPRRGLVGAPGGERVGAAGALMLARVPSLFYAAAADRVWIHQYGPSAVTLRSGGRPVHLAQTTTYPAGEDVLVEVTPGTAEFDLCLRLPGWCDQPSIKLNRSPVAIHADRGYLTLRRIWRAGDRLELHFPMPQRRGTELHRGPLLYYRSRAELKTSRQLPETGPLGPIYEIRGIPGTDRNATAVMQPFALLGLEPVDAEYTTDVAAE